MSTSMANPDLRRKIKVRMRPDLIITRQSYDGQGFFVVKDPVALRYYRFREEELFLLKQFDGKKNFDDVRHEFVERFRPQRISVTELEKFVQQLLQVGIATADTPQLGQRLYERGRKRKRDKFKQALLNILYIKVPLFDPERLLTRMMPYVRWFFSPVGMLAAVALWISAILLIMANFDTFMAKLPSYTDFFNWKTILLLWATLAITKVLHEFGHGLSCKYYGGEVHEMGLLVLVLSPCLYCNVTDAWMLPNKWHRAFIGAAGIYVELILASLAVWIWWYSEPGLLNTLSLAVVTICSVSTILFNANPLLRFDGYYILSDLMEIPNLRERANKYLGNVASRFFFGSEAVIDPYTPKRRRWFFILFAIASYVYRWVISVAILYFLYTFLKPYKLGTISALLAGGALVSLVVVPIYRISKTLKNRWRQMKVKPGRMLFSFSVAALAISAILFTPFPMWLDFPFVLQPRDGTSLFVQTPGVLKELLVEDGDRAVGGMLLARLEDPNLQISLAKAELERDTYSRQAKALQFNNNPSEAQQATLRARAAEEYIASLRRDLDNLRLYVPPDASGRVISPPKRTDLGKTLRAGDVFCQIGDPARLEAYIVITHSDRTLIHPGQSVWLKFAGHVGQIRETTVEQLSSTSLDMLPPALSNKMGGEVPTETDPSGKWERPLTTSYAVQADVPNPDRLLTPGVRGVARIEVGWRSLYWRIKRYVQQTFHFAL